MHIKRYLMRTLIFSLLIGLGTSVHATIWIVDAVLQGSDGGYGYSSFHDASTGSVMSGPSLGSVTGIGIVGTFDDDKDNTA